MFYLEGGEAWSTQMDQQVGLTRVARHVLVTSVFVLWLLAWCVLGCGAYSWSIQMDKKMEPPKSHGFHGFYTHLIGLGPQIESAPI